MNIFKRLWNEDDGAIITTEFLLIVSMLITGLVPAYTGYRDMLAGAYGNVGQLIYNETSNVQVPPLTVVGSNGKQVASTFNNTTNVTVNFNTPAP